MCPQHHGVKPKSCRTDTALNKPNERTMGSALETSVADANKLHKNLRKALMSMPNEKRKAIDC